MDIWNFDDFDEYSSAVQDVNLKMMLNKLVHRSWAIRHLDLGGVHIQHGLQGSGDITEGQSRQDGYLLYLPMQNAQIQRACGVALESNSMVVLPPGCEFCLSSNLNHEWCTIFVPIDQLGTEDDPWIGTDGPNASPCRVVNLPQLTWRRIRDLSQRLLNACEMHDPVAELAGCQSAVQQLVQLTSQAIRFDSDSQPSRRGRPEFSKADIVRRSQALAEVERTDPLSVRELAVACDVSERTLRTAFQEYFSSAPLQYFQLRHLHEVRRALQHADPDSTSVTSILMEHGEWELGRFASRYRALFGELPSETLAAATRL